MSSTSDMSEDEQLTHQKKENMADGTDMSFLDDEDDVLS